MDYSVFGSVPVPKKKRTLFNESHSLSGTFPLSKVCPVCFIDSLPGSSWDINVHNLTKLETLIAPAMQRVDASLLWFKVPKRLVFQYFKDWYSGGDTGEDTHQKPHIFIFEIIDWIYNNILDRADQDELIVQLFGPGSVWNYLGLPCPIYYDPDFGTWNIYTCAELNMISDGSSDWVDMMPFMAYHYIYDCYFRDQSLSNSFFVDSENNEFIINRGATFHLPNNVVYIGPADHVPSDATISIASSGQNLFSGGKIPSADAICLFASFNRAWRKDYFTSALPTPQRGPEVSLSLLGEAPVEIDGSDAEFSNPLFHTDDTLTAATGNAEFLGKALGTKNQQLAHSDGGTNTLINSVNGQLTTTGTADLTGISPITIVALRNLFKLQQFLEKNNVAGGRYIESILAHWGERVPDFTVQRPQFIRATSLPVQIMEVTATANSSGVNSVVGDQAGRARTQGNLGRVHVYTQEPSFIFGLYCVTAPPSYAGQGIPRVFQHKTRFDEPWTEFQHIGEQAIKSRELYFDFISPEINDLDFGYQQRYSEYKFMPDRVVGYFQTSLAYWHMARMFNDQPTLNDDFVTQHLDPRIFAVQNSHPVTADFFFDIKSKIKLSKYSTPKLT